MRAPFGGPHIIIIIITITIIDVNDHWPYLFLGAASATGITKSFTHSSNKYTEQRKMSKGE